MKYPLLALAGRPATLVTMGGVWSNHVHATAYAANLSGFDSVALVRGAPEMRTAMLEDCAGLGMRIVYVPRVAYGQLRESDSAWRDWVPDLPANAVWLPEGGSAPAALHGVAELVDELPFIPDLLAVACGTGATLAGLLAGLRGRGRVLGIAVLKNADYLREEIVRLLLEAGYPAYDNYELLTEFHQGGYGKAPPHLRQFCREFSAETGVPIEPVYSGKLFYALHQLIEKGQLSPTQSLIAVHTGGMQGARGFL